MRVKGRAEVFLQNPGKASDVAQGSAQIVGHRVGKGLQFLIGFIQLGGTLQDTLFQFLVELANLAFGRPSLGNVAERHHAAVEVALRIEQRTASHFDPDAFRKGGIADEHLRRIALT